MRKLLLLLLVISGFTASGQTQTQEPKVVELQENEDAPYLKYKDLPAFRVVYLNGKDTFNTYDIPEGKQSLIVYFSPDCDHCKKLIDAMLPKMNKLKNVNIYFMTFMPVIALQIFNRQYHLENYPPVKLIGQDYQFFFPTFYGTSTVPNVVLYDKNKKFVKLWKKEMTIEEILKEIK